MTNEQRVVEAARVMARSAETWADLSNALFAPGIGIVAKALPTRDEREQFVKSNEYAAIRQLVDAARERTGLVAGATPSKSGKFGVRQVESGEG